MTNIEEGDELDGVSCHPIRNINVVQLNDTMIEKADPFDGVGFDVLDGPKVESDNEKGFFIH